LTKRGSATNESLVLDDATQSPVFEAAVGFSIPRGLGARNTNSRLKLKILKNQS
jgi:hypothetical protein